MKRVLRMLSDSDKARKSNYLQRSILSSARCEHTENQNLDFQFKEKFVQIKSCGQLYKKWKNEGKFKTVPSSDLTFNVPYIDTHSKSNHSSLPLTVALHGAPGSWKDFTLLTSHLYQQGIRVVAPSFPDFRTYRPGIFRHSDEEKAEYISDFLKAIDIKQVNTLVCHSSAIYPGLLLCLKDRGINIKSLALLNPGSFSPEKMRATKYLKELEYIVNGSENYIIFKLMETFGPFFLKFVKLPVRVEHCLDPLLSLTVMTNGNITSSKEKLQQLSCQKFPILFAFSENDTLINKEASYDIAHVLGAEKSDIYYFNSEAQLEHEGKELPFLKSLCFENGSHYVFWKHSEVINKELSNFILKNV
ncbi:uncharacterized protein LOC129217585 [Uloborus diversus]|uniref:uncharacterized protein LOC129217585 n=1 Tax=Uloborus diversus TaxID=327109 RepID=UPI002409414D|nr:uncharacterized protein LOC129217585 [Uloborus diversus]